MRKVDLGNVSIIHGVKLEFFTSSEVTVFSNPVCAFHRMTGSGHRVGRAAWELCHAQNRAFSLPALNWGLTVSQAGGWVGLSDQLCFISIVRVVRNAGAAALDCSPPTQDQLQCTNGKLALRSHIFKEFKKGSQVLRISKKHAQLWICLYFGRYLHFALCLFKYINSCFAGITRWLTTTFG